jgi:DNA-binding MarR family transcriptional regulator
MSEAHDDLRLWLRLFSSTNLIAGELRSRLQSRFKTSLARFDLMAQLERVPDGLTMSAVSKRLLVTNAAVTGIVEALVTQGWVARTDDSGDRRRSIICLTAQGRTAFLGMAQEHETWVVALLAKLPEPEKASLYRLLGSLKQSLNG